MRGKFGRGKQRNSFLLPGISAGAQAIFAAHCVVVKQQLTRFHSRNWKQIAARLERQLCLFFCLFFLPRSTAVNAAPPTQPRSSHSQASLLLDTVGRAGRRAGVLGREPPALFSSSSNSFNKLLLLLNEWRAIVVLSWWIHSLFPAWLQGNFQLSYSLTQQWKAMESSSKQQCSLGQMRIPHWRRRW